MSFLQTLENVELPKVLRVTEGCLRIPRWRTFKAGECIAVFSCERQIIVKGCLKSTESRDLKQELGFIPFDTSELFYDIHCIGKKYTAIDELVKDFPRFLLPTSDVFAIVEKESDCESIRLEKRSLLEVEEIREYKGNSCSQEDYTNAQDLHGEMLCCTVKDGPNSGLDIILPNTLRCEMEIIQDTEKYSMQDIVERFNLPRKLKFCDPKIDQHLIDTKKLENEILASSLSNKMIFLADLGKCNLECIDEFVRECSNVVCDLVENLDLSHVHVEVLKNTMEEIEIFSPFYAFPETPTFDNIQTYTLKGTDKQPGSSDLTKGESVTEEHPPPRRREFDEYIQLWDPTKSNDTNVTGSKTGSYDALIGLGTPPQLSSPTCATHITQPPNGSKPERVTPPSVLNISDPAPVKPRVSPTTGQMNYDRVPSPTLPPRVREKSHTIPTTPVKVSCISKRSGSLPTDSLAVSADSDHSNSIHHLGVEQLCSLLKEYKLDKLAEVCVDEKLDGNFLACLNDDDLKEEPFCLGNFQIKKLNKLKTGWRSK